MKYILLVFHIHSGGGAGMSAEFDSMIACENAIMAMSSANEKFDRYYNPVCVPKGHINTHNEEQADAD